MGLSRNKVAVPEGAAGTPPFWRECLDKGSKKKVGFETLRLLVLRTLFYGGLAQLARAPALQAGGQRFESVILHHSDALDYALSIKN